MERSCLPPIVDSVNCDSGSIHTFCEEDKTMGKGNNSQKNDKKNKKPKKDGKAASKPADKK